MATSRERKREIQNPLLNVLFRAGYFTFLLAILILEFPGAVEFFKSPDPGIDTQDLVVQRVRDPGPNSDGDLRPGDRIVSVGGQRIRNQFHYLNVVSGNHAFQPMDYVVLRDGAPVTVRVYFDTVTGRRQVQFLGSLILALAFLLVGTWVYLRRPDALGSLFALNCAILASFLTHRPSVSSPTLQLTGELFHDAVMLLFPAVFLHFFLVFPGRPQNRGKSERYWRLVALYSVPAALYLVSGIVVVSRFDFRPVPNAVVSSIVAASTLYFAGYILASLVLFVRSYRRSPRAQRQKLRVVTAGTLAGILPFVFTLIVNQVAPGEYYFMELASVLCLGFVPATFAYAILKHGAIELNNVVRKGLVYALLSGAIIAVYYVLVALLGDFVLRELNVARYVFMPFAVLVFAVTFAPARVRIQRLVDRLFFRGEYVFREEVLRFNRDLARKLTPEEIYDTYVERVETLLKSSFVAVYTRNGERALRVAKTLGDCKGLPDTFSLNSFLGRYFSRYVTPLMVEFLDPSWERRNLDSESRRYLEIPGLSVCVPVVAHDRFLCLILLGEKRSGLVYNRRDTALLATFSEQLALVLQNAELLQSSIEQERLLKEVKLARDIQLSLLPPVPPDHPAIDIHGTMESSFEVGGDYFDYFFIDNDRIALAIGDVSGKGIPAAMLMSSLQALFKNLAVRDNLAPADLNAELNTFLLNRANTEQFATFFYGVLDLRQYRFTFSNAGHCPALLVKDGFVDRLGQGGMLLGVREAEVYREGSVAIEPGDLLVLYTDGVTEQKRDDGEEYGEDRLISFLRKNRKLPIRELQSALFEEILEFGGGTQQDDLTSVFAYTKTG